MKDEFSIDAINQEICKALDQARLEGRREGLEVAAKVVENITIQNRWDTAKDIRSIDPEKIGEKNV